MRDDDENAGNDCIDSPKCTSEKKQCFGQEPTEKQKTPRETEPQHITLATAPPSKRTEAASAASQGNALIGWKAVIPAMCAIYHEYLSEGPRPRTRNEMKRDFTKQGAKLSKAQLDFFRSFLPDGHVNKSGGATIQKS